MPAPGLMAPGVQPPARLPASFLTGGGGVGGAVYTTQADPGPFGASGYEPNEPLAVDRDDGLGEEGEGEGEEEDYGGEQHFARGKGRARPALGGADTAGGTAPARAGAGRTGSHRMAMTQAHILAALASGSLGPPSLEAGGSAQAVPPSRSHQLHVHRDSMSTKDDRDVTVQVGGDEDAEPDVDGEGLAEGPGGGGGGGGSAEVCFLCDRGPTTT